VSVIALALRLFDCGSISYFASSRLRSEVSAWRRRVVSVAFAFLANFCLNLVVYSWRLLSLAAAGRLRPPPPGPERGGIRVCTRGRGAFSFVLTYFISRLS